MSTQGIRLEGIRLDIWLWRARFFKTRYLSARLISKGRVRILRGNQIFRASKPHSEIFIGDILTLTLGARLIQIEVLDLGTRRGSAPEARGLYCEIPIEPPTDIQSNIMAKTK